MGKRGQRFVNLLADASWTPEEMLPNTPIVELVGNRRILVERHCGISEYTDTMICVRLRDGSLRIYGTELCVTRMMKHQLVVVGCIRGLELGQVV